MIYGIWHSAAGAVTQDAQVDVLANNLANVNTPGFRKEFLVFKAREAETHEDKPDLKYLNPLLDKMKGGLFLSRTYFDRQPGPIQVTDRPLDLALEGEGFLGVRRNGSVYYTRAGNLSVGPDGLLRTADGQGVVLSADGGEIVVPETGEFNVLKSGEVVTPAGAVPLMLVEFDDLDNLFKAGDSLYEWRGPAAPAPATATTVLQGALEGSSANPVSEMVQLIQAFRAYEGNLAMLRNQDGTWDRAVNDVGRAAGR
ncbi:MAG: flagellar hook-basal body protein [Planctomycetes bacterium]|nr:flagellar hook-basal body protein [Planctomycetota bacterium]